MFKLKRRRVLVAFVSLFLVGVVVVVAVRVSQVVAADRAAATAAAKKEETERHERNRIKRERQAAIDAAAEKSERREARRLAKAFCAGDESLFALDTAGVSDRTDRLCPGEEQRQRAAIAKEYEELEADPPVDYDDPMYSSDNEFEFAAGDHTCKELRAWYSSNPMDSNLQIAQQFFIVCGDIPPPVLSGEISDADEFFGL